MSLGGKRSLLLALLLQATAGLVLAQTPGGEDTSESRIPGSALGAPHVFTLSGELCDRDGPLAGAVLSLELESSQYRQEVRSSATGEYRVELSEPGRYRLEAKHPGHQASTGLVDVGQARQRLDIELLLLDETMPHFAEGNPRATLEAWLARGNALLDEGQNEAARVEFEKADALLSNLQATDLRETHVQVILAIARTHYLAENYEAAIEHLEAALRLDRTNERAVALYDGLMEALGRPLRAKDFDGAPAAPRPPTETAQAADSPRVASAVPGATPSSAQPIKAEPFRPSLRGTLTVSFAQASPLGTYEEILKRYDRASSQQERSSPAGSAWSTAQLGEEHFSLVIPESYQDDGTWGLLVFISPAARGGPPREATRVGLEERKLIYVGAHNSGNRRAVWQRAALALAAAHNLRTQLELDDSRVYVSGYSGGGRMSAALSLLFPEVFQGAIGWFGFSYWDAVPVPFRPGHSWPQAFEPPSRKTRRAVMRHSRFALVTGERDFNRSETRMIWDLMKRDGFRHTAYLQIPDADHYLGLEPRWFLQAVDLIDVGHR